MLKLGEIYRGKVAYRKNNVYHPLVCLEDETNAKTTIDACVLTHSLCGMSYQNIPMKKEHFLENDEQGNPYSFKFENTCMVQNAFEKELFWIDDKCIGKLSQEGIDFVLQNSRPFGPAIKYPKPLQGK